MISSFNNKYGLGTIMSDLKQHAKNINSLVLRSITNLDSTSINYLLGALIRRWTFTRMTCFRAEVRTIR